MHPPLRVALLSTVLVSASCVTEPGATRPADLRGRPTPARALVQRSLRHHDPAGAWRTTTTTFRWVGLDVEGNERYAFDVEHGPDHFAARGERGGHALDYRVAGERVEVKVDGSADVPDDVREALALTREDGRFWQGYIGFLAGIPMCIADPGARLEPDVTREELGGRAVDAVRVTFDPDVGTDRWTFYFDPETARCVGCRFDRADPTRDGETIELEGEVELGSLRLPETRHWTMNADGRFLGSERIEAP